MSREDKLRIPPQSVEAEQAVLGGLMLQPAALAIVADILDDGDFYRRDHRILFKAITACETDGLPFDAVTLGEWLEVRGLSKELPPNYLIDLASTTPSAANIKAYAEIVAEKALLRGMVEAGTDIVNQAFAPDGRASDELVSNALQTMLNFKQRTVRGGLHAPKAGLKQWFKDFRKRFDGSGIVGLVTPFFALNKATHGLPNALIVLAGRPSMGKSLLGSQITDFTCARGLRAAKFSVEMDEETNHQRSIACLAEVPHDYLVSPASDEWKNKHDEFLPRIEVALGDIAKYDMLIDDQAMLTAAQICARARRAHAQRPLHLILIDHLHDVKVDKNNEVASYGEAMRMFQQLRKDLGIPVIVVAQLNRANVGRTDKRPTMADLRASGEIEQIADLIIFVHREDYYDSDEHRTHLQGVVELIIAKGRNMRRGQTIYLKNEFEMMRCSDWSGELPEQPVKESTRGMPSTRKPAF